MNKNYSSLTRFNLKYNLKTKTFELPERIRLPDCPMPSEVLGDFISSLHRPDIKSSTGIPIP